MRPSKFFLFLIIALALPSLTCAALTPMEGWDIPPAEKAQIFEKKLHELHDVNGMILSDIRIYTGQDGSTWTVPGYDDSAYWTGNYLLAECLRYAVTKDPEAKENAARSARALIRLTQVSSKPGLLVRGYMDASMSDRFRLTPNHSEYTYVTPDGIKYIGLDASVDQLIGAIQGFHYACRYLDDDALRAEIKTAVASVLDHIIEHNYTMEDLDGKPTTWGVFTPGRTIETLHAFLILVVFRVGAYITGEKRHEDAYWYLYSDMKYGKKARIANMLASLNRSDDAMEFMGYINVFQVEDNHEARKVYLSSLRRTWDKKVKTHDKAFLNLIAYHYLEDLPDNEEVLRQAIEQIRNFPTMKEHHTVDYSSYPRHNPKLPNPIQFRPVDCGYYWTADTFETVYVKPPEYLQISPGHDFLMVYWLARHWGYLNE
ncbi:MAG: hypothetical protein AB1546_00280 [bacterium]